MHSYRVRWGHADTDPSCDELEARLKTKPRIAVPTLVLHEGADPCNLPATLEGKDALFTGPYIRHVVPAGHFPQREAPEPVLDRLLPFLSAIDP